jgi:hypothetical protein
MKDGNNLEAYLNVFLKCLLFWGGVDCGLNSGLHTCKAGALPLEPHLQSILLRLFWRSGSFRKRTASKCDPPNLSLPSS